ncbi:DUF3883 domain-containing protein [Vibrio breoganii]
MNNNFFPPNIWFDTAIEVVEFARQERKKDDFIVDAKLRPQIIGQSYSYRIDVMEQLIRTEIVKIQDDRLVISNSFDVEWLDYALITGNAKAWKFADALDRSQVIDKKFNPEVLKKIGDTGEKFVLNELRKYHPIELHSQINHVAEYDDTLGYDICAPSIVNSDHNSFLEVKTSVRQISGKFQFFLSRNEFDVGISNREWCIVAVSIVDNKPLVLGHLYCYQIESRLPRDIDDSAKWVSCKLSVEMEIFRPGLP